MMKGFRGRGLARATRLLVVVVPCSLVQSSGVGAEGGRGLTPLQVIKMRRVLSVHPSPDGSRVAFVRTSPRLAAKESQGRSYKHLYIVPSSGGEERLLIGGDKSISGVSWKPDGTVISFIDKRGDDKHEQIYALPMEGGEPYAITRAESAVKSYRWRGDGGAIAYTMSDKVPSEIEKAEEYGFKQVVVDESWQPTSLHVWDLKDGSSRRLTEDVAVTDFEWAPDGKRIAAAVAPTPRVDDVLVFARLYLVDTEEPALERLVENPGKLGDFAWSPDSRAVAYVSAADRNDPHAGMLYVVDVATKVVRALTPGFEGMVHEIHWIDTDRLRACVSQGVYTRLRTMNVRGSEWQDESPRSVAFRGFEVSRNGESLVAAASTASYPPEVHVYGDGWKRLTRSNPWLADVELGRQEVVSYRASDGLEIQGLLLYPVGYDEAKRYPLVILAHGGPESHFDDGWNTSYGRWGQLLCARGYFAWYPNYRASTGRGVEFAKADHGDIMGAEFQDHLDAIEHLSERGLVDKERVGIGGGSYGGFTAAWAATRHTEHFAASVSFVPVTDLATKWYTSDIPYELYYVHYTEKWPHEQTDFLRERSPLTYAAQCRTPLLLLGGTSDTRVHPSQPYMLYSAVKFATQTTVLYVQYPGEGHGNVKNVYRYDYCVRTLRWFDHYLRPGNHRQDPKPPQAVDYAEWFATDEKPAEGTEMDPGREK